MYASDEVVTFAPIAQKLLDLRFSGNIFAKRILNSIYGRLAIEPAPTKTHFLLLDSNPLFNYNPSTQLTLWRDLMIIEQPCKSKHQIKSNKAYAAIITARARAKLYGLIQQVQSDAQILYIDTDELFVKPLN